MVRGKEKKSWLGGYYMLVRENLKRVPLFFVFFTFFSEYIFSSYLLILLVFYLWICNLFFNFLCIISLIYMYISHISQSSAYLFFLVMFGLDFFGCFILFCSVSFDEFYFIILEVVKFQRNMMNYDFLCPQHFINITWRGLSKWTFLSMFTFENFVRLSFSNVDVKGVLWKIS